MLDVKNSFFSKITIENNSQFVRLYFITIPKTCSRTPSTLTNARTLPHSNTHTQHRIGITLPTTHHHHPRTPQSPRGANTVPSPSCVHEMLQNVYKCITSARGRSTTAQFYIARCDTHRSYTQHAPMDNHSSSKTQESQCVHRVLLR